MKSFYESHVEIKNNKDLKDFEVIASRLQINGLVVLGIEQQNLPQDVISIDLVSRLEISDDNLSKIRNLLGSERRKYEILSVKTLSAKIAQWVVKDNRVDILHIPFEKMKEIITQELANVASQNGTFLEIDCNPLLNSKNRSFFLRTVSRVMNNILNRKAPFLLTFSVSNPLMLRDRRAIIALASLLGISEKAIKSSIQMLSERIILNRSKLESGYVLPGIIEVSEKKEKIPLKSNIKDDDEFYTEISFPLDEFSNDTFKFERQRYFLFEILTKSDKEIPKKILEDAIWNIFGDLFGEVGSSRIGFYIQHYDPHKKIGIIRCSHLI
ncbi:MAG: hypothetical protein FK734_12400, partial [Asgard group archaeon]|nr:hypothetical protein [Asgard group archaeon]